MSLEEYWSKRDFRRTPEPRGEVADGDGRRFVVQEHHASSLHWDLRLERDGVLRSWAFPKGVPKERGVRRLAVQTEDHPLEYAGFRGRFLRESTAAERYSYGMGASTRRRSGGRGR